MLDLKEIEDEIRHIEAQETNYQNCTKLAVLYSIQDHHKKAQTVEAYSFSQSEFMQATAGAPLDRVLAVIDEHLEGIKVLYPREYRAIIRNIKGES